MEPVLLALWATAVTAGPAVAAFVLWRVSHVARPAADPTAVNELTAARRVVRDAFSLEQPGGPIDVTSETRGVGRQVVVLTARVPANVWVEPVRPLRLAQRDLGDPAFDRRFECGGDTALLTADVRAALLEAARFLDVRVVGGMLEGRWATVPDGSRGASLALTLQPHVDRLVAVRAAFPTDVHEAWLRTALRDPVPAVRVRAIDHLVATGDRRASLALEAAASSPIPEVALAAALHTFDLPLLRELACATKLTQDHRRAALAALFEHDDVPGLAPVVASIARDPLVTDLVSLLDHRPIEPLVMLAAAEIQATGLAGLSERARHDVEQALAGILGRLSPSPAAEDALVYLLGADDELAVRAAARALGTIGTGRCVAALRSTRGSPTVMRAVGQAVRAIQARAAGQEGGVALASERPEVGALSPAVEGSGALAEAELRAERRASEG